MGMSQTNKVRYKKRIRLPNFNYKGGYRYFITICTYNKKLVFNNRDIGYWIIEILRILSDKSEFTIWAYCLMPDHIHLLIEGKHDRADMRSFISLFKQKTGYEYKLKYGGKLWQINYYEHVLRSDENTKEIAYYILNNSVRKGIVESYKQYPYLGSFVFDV